MSSKEDGEVSVWRGEAVCVEEVSEIFQTFLLFCIRGFCVVGNWTNLTSKHRSGGWIPVNSTGLWTPSVSVQERRHTAGYVAGC